MNTAYFALGVVFLGVAAPFAGRARRQDGAEARNSRFAAGAFAVSGTVFLIAGIVSIIAAD